jgi:hypothetical protein
MAQYYSFPIPSIIDRRPTLQNLANMLGPLTLIDSRKERGDPYDSSAAQEAETTLSALLIANRQ